MIDAAILIETYCTAEEKIKIANAILLSQDIYEDSWDSNNNQYTIDLFNAAKESVKEYKLPDDISHCILHWNHFYWNDIQSWAALVIDECGK